MKVDQVIGKRGKSDDRAVLDSSHNVCGEMCKDSRISILPLLDHNNLNTITTFPYYA